MRTGWVSAGLVLLALMAAIPARAESRLAESRALVRDAGADAAAGKSDAALAGFTRAIEMRVLPPAEQAGALLRRGLVLDGLGRLGDALGDYDAALRLQPRLAPALNNRANIHRRQGHFAAAQADYEAALTAGNPAPQYSWFGLGGVAEARHDLAGARRDYRRALDIDPGYEAAARRLAVLDPPVVLKPPVSAPLTLRRPGAPGAIHLHPPPTVVPAAWRGERHPGLRPALDGAASRQVQLGAWRQESEAMDGWAHAVTRSGALLSGLAPHVVAADLPGRGRFYRLRVNTTQPAALCAALAAKGQDCLPVPP